MKLNDDRLLREALLIDGQWQSASTGHTGDDLAAVPDAGAAEAQRAVAAAESAFGPWRDRTADERAEVLRRWHGLLLAHLDDLAVLLTSEQGKPLAEARAEILYAASYLQWFAEEARRIYGEVVPSPWRDRRIVVVREPVGVCAAITPWNFPAAMIARKVAPALAVGCTMVVKPAEQTPLSALALAELGQRAGLPPGVLNVVTGDARAIGAVFTGNPVVKKLSFTGSTEVGRLLTAQCAPTLKKLSMELGGNAPFIVFDDAALDAAVEGAIASKYRNAGQTCVCTNRILVQDRIHDACAARLAEAVHGLVVGNGMDPRVVQGPLIDDAAMAKVESLVADALQRGGRLLAGGHRHAMGGSYFEPTVIADATPSMALSREEIFGPVAPIYRFDTEDDAMRLANDTEFGLAAYFFSRSQRRCWRVAERLQYGMVGINTGLISTAVAPFGGVKQSGGGREGSKHGADDYLQLKYLCMGGMD